MKRIKDKMAMGSSDLGLVRNGCLFVQQTALPEQPRVLTWESKLLQNGNNLKMALDCLGSKLGIKMKAKIS